MPTVIYIFRSPLYLPLALGTSMLVFASAVLFPNQALLFSLWTDSSVSIAGKITFPIQLLGSIATNFAPLTVFYLITIAALVGVNVALTGYLLRKGGVVLAPSSTGAVGIFSGVLGLGCAACGSLILTAILGTALGASIISVLPLRGGEFGIFGVALLFASTYLLSKQITRPAVCKT